MADLVRRGALACAFLLLGGVTVAAEPLPRPAAPEIYLATPAYPVYYRRSAYDVWQYYGVDRQGGFRPRVVYSPYGPYYLSNGAPYPWTITHQRDFMPYVVD